MRRDGMLLVVETLNPELRSLLARELTYVKHTFLRGWAAKAAGRKFMPVPTACFSIKTDPHGVLPSVLMTAAGYLSRISAALREAGWTPLLKDVSPTRRDFVFQPRWARLDDVDFRWQQRELLELMVQYAQRNRPARIDCPPGYGKSFIIKCLARLLPKARIDVTTHSLDVIRQIFNDLRGDLPSVGFVGGGKRRYDERVMCYSGKSLHHAAGDADILLVDEGHEFATPDYLARLARYTHSRRFMFSASQDVRADNADFELLGAFGPIAMTIPYAEAVAHQCIVPIEVWWEDVYMDCSPCDSYDDPTARNRWGIWRNETRNEVIAAAARRFPEDDQVLVTVATVEHAAFLKQKLPEFTLCYGENGLTEADRERYVRWGLLTRDEPRMTLSRREQLKDAFSAGELKKVIATGVWNRGVDFRDLAVLVRADAQDSAVADTQIPGRVSRLGQAAGKECGIVIDFRDQFDAYFKRKAGNRERRYEKQKWLQRFPEYNASLERFTRR